MQQDIEYRIKAKCESGTCRGQTRTFICIGKSYTSNAPIYECEVCDERLETSQLEEIQGVHRKNGQK